MSKLIQNVSFKIHAPPKKYNYQKIADEYYGKMGQKFTPLPLQVHAEMYDDAGFLKKFAAQQIDQVLKAMSANMDEITLTNGNPAESKWKHLSNVSPIEDIKKAMNELKDIKVGAMVKAAYGSSYGMFYPPPMFRRDPTPPAQPHPKPPRYSAEHLNGVAVKMARKYDLINSIGDFAPAVPEGYARFEVTCHEVIHCLLVDPTNIMSSDDVALRIRQMPGWLANDHEVATLRIEAIALQRYFGKANIEWVYERSNWRPPGKYPPGSPWIWNPGAHNKPPIEKLREPLTIAECAIAERFHAVIREFL